ncbi:3-oxo-tetronate kinase [Streptomyces antimycoticus]|uniref:3-oxo-tetronate kinase n=1 Tax=Streptomyces antimycoticus TaxID=68175 RepID=UPI000A3B681E|nr:3-oxo-tetronate kinase [Streptomyces antimycoticus]WTA86161.1 four-carbon acid sugar kinase family protein [Streptomyces antimycoticus]WTB03280.1 four-carbon acid sugar kinase family protein [Streptomyces antimycoticus]
MLLGCIADDFTGGTDLASALVAQGIRTVQVIGVPETGEEVVRSGAEAVVIALKTRTAPVADAVEQSLTALRWLREIGCERYYFKYCSTFDSTPAGNIGPVADALMDALGMDFTVICPALPANGRTVRDGRLFVGDAPLDETSMRQHPLTPMDDANVVRLMRRQTASPVGLVGHGTVAQGPERIRAEFDALRSAGIRFAVVDATDDHDLLAIGRACADLPLVTASSGLAIGLTETPRARPHGLTDGDPHAPVPFGGARAVIAGSCSAATNAQVEAARAVYPTFPVDPCAVVRGEDVVTAALRWARPLLADGPVLLHATQPARNVTAAKSRLPDDTASRIEDTLASIARGLVDMGVGRLIVAGGETSGAVVGSLGVTGLVIGPEISPGVPWTWTLGTPRPLALALKSGNFGSRDFFLDAWERLP